MNLSWLAQGAATAERNRNRIARAGMTMSGSLLWTDEEIATLRRLYPLLSYVQLTKHLKGRTWMAIRHKAQKMGLAEARHVWTGAEIAKLRRLYQKGTMQDVREAFPDFSVAHIRGIARNHGIRRPRRPFKATGIPAIDQIRQRAFELGYSMPDIDHLARSKKYFQQGGWHSGHVNHRAVARAIGALDGAVSAEWN